MADSIYKGITITFRGDTTEFDKGVSKIDSELKDLKAETKLLNRELKLDPNNFDKLSQKLTGLQKQEGLLKEKLDAYNQAMKEAEIGSKAFEDAQKQARELQIELAYVEKAIDRLGGNKVSLAINVMAKELENAGKKVEDLGKKFAGLSTACAGIITAFGKLSYDVVKSADDINTLSKQTGLSTDTLQAFGQMADLIDVDLNTLSKSAVYLTKNLDNKTTLNAYKKLGVAVKDNNGNFRATEDILFDTLKALQRVEDETTRNMIASDVFGKSYSALGSIINDVGVDLDDVTESIKKNGRILSKDELTALNDVNDSIDTMKIKASALGTSLVAEFKEPIATLVDNVSKLFDKVIEFVNSLSTEQKQKILNVIVIIASISPILIVIGKTIGLVATAFSTLSNVVGFLVTTFKGLKALFVADPIGMTITAIMALVAVVIYLYNNCEGFRDLVNRIGAYLKDIFLSILDKVKTAFDNVATFVQDTRDKMASMWEQFKQTEFAQTFIDIFNKVKEAIEGVIEALKSVYNWFGSVISRVGDFFASGISKVAGWFGSGGFGNAGAFASGGYGTLELQTTINVNNNGANISSLQAQQFGRQIVEYVNDKLGRRI